MRARRGTIRLSASDLANHLGCRYLTELDRRAARGELKVPVWRDPALEVLQERGFEHEANYLEQLRGEGRAVTTIAADEGHSAFERTCEAMRSGADVIVQAVLERDHWYGLADILLRTTAESQFGDWSYEVVDTKLARETKAGTILQLCMYTDVVGDLQGRQPEFMHVVSPGEPLISERFRVNDYFAYYRFVRSRLETAVEGPADGLYPDPVPQCDVCRWWSSCDTQRRGDDHLSLVAGISKLQRAELESRGVSTLADLARLPIPLEWRPGRGGVDTYVRVREQARVQLQQRETGEPVYELLEREAERGLLRLPAPSPGDMFFDIEGDPFVARGGLEYLLGFVTVDAGGEKFEGIWALSSVEERAAFERFIDIVMERWNADPTMHVYHYAPYEPSAMKRLMGRYATREDEVDRLLRAGIFVDLYQVVRQAIRGGVERYSIKNLEAFYGFERQVPLEQASATLRSMERALERGVGAEIPDDVLESVRGYNEDDCVSTLRLRDWLESLRSQLIDNGEDVPRPEPRDGEPSEEVDERRQRTLELMERLLGGLPEDTGEWSAEQRGQWLLAHTLEFHRRESKASWWEYFRLQSLADEDLLEETGAVAGLEFVGRIGGTAKCPIDRYHFPKQDTEVREDDDLHATGEQKIGKVAAIDMVERTLDVKKAGAAKDVHPTAVFAHSIVNTAVLAESLHRLGSWVADHGADADGRLRAARDLLLYLAPRVASSSLGLQQDGESVVAAACRLAHELERGVLAIQGPPGAGKTFTGSRMICELARAGKRVGVTAVSHKVIRNLLDAVVEAADSEGIRVRCLQKVAHTPDKEAVAIQETNKNGRALTALADGAVDVVGATAWLWARQDALQAVDVLFVDEAGQMSLPDVLAVAQAAESVVLLGDPQQLEQPIQASHPEGVAVSALEHLLRGHKTIPRDRGLFLPETWRLHSSICAMTSELFYEGRLASYDAMDNQQLVGVAPFDGAGLWFVPVPHEGNRSSSVEEVECVAGLVEELLRDGAGWVDHQGAQHALGPDDILIVAPYNAQVADISERMPGARVGTVDKFQGQQAPVVIYSMTTSSPDEAPRGMEFLYSLNRLNVATSRARCVCILVASPRLFEPECRTPRQIQLANAFCRYVELSRTP